MSENTTHESPAYEKRGYLNHEFRLFHLRGQMDTPVAYHYHDFHKVLILLNGEADYIVEGRSYHLRPLDIVLVGAHCLHKPVVPYKSRYERIILYLSPECLDAFSCADCALDLCFQLAREQQSDVLRLGSLTMTPLLEALSRLENAYQAGGTNDNGTDNANFESLGGSSYGSELLLRLLFLEEVVERPSAMFVVPFAGEQKDAFWLCPKLVQFPLKY
jgi:mannose-6-phosphate isomerase-like protein (cupin superfamily)